MFAGASEGNIKWLGQQIFSNPFLHCDFRTVSVSMTSPHLFSSTHFPCSLFSGWQKSSSFTLLSAEKCVNKKTATARTNRKLAASVTIFGLLVIAIRLLNHAGYKMNREKYKSLALSTKKRFKLNYSRTWTGLRLWVGASTRSVLRQLNMRSSRREFYSRVQKTSLWRRKELKKITHMSQPGWLQLKIQIWFYEWNLFDYQLKHQLGSSNCLLIDRRSCLLGTEVEHISFQRFWIS